MSLSLATRIALIEHEVSELFLTQQAALLGVSRSSLYYQPTPPSAEEVALKHWINEIYTQCPFYRSRRITAALHREGVIVHRKAVQRHMQEMGIAGVAPGPQWSTPHLEQLVYPYLLRHVTSAWPDHVWGIDITSMRMEAGWLSLVAVLAWYSRCIVSWALGQTLELLFVLEAAQQALGQATPQIWNNDQGNHFTSPHYLILLQATQVQISVDGKGRTLEKSSPNGSGALLSMRRSTYTADVPQGGRRGPHPLFAFYNYRRSHQALAYHTPAEIYFATPDPPRRGAEKELDIRATRREGGDPTLEPPLFIS